MLDSQVPRMTPEGIVTRSLSASPVRPFTTTLSLTHKNHTLGSDSIESAWCVRLPSVCLCCAFRLGRSLFAHKRRFYCWMQQVRPSCHSPQKAFPTPALSTVPPLRGPRHSPITTAIFCTGLARRPGTCVQSRAVSRDSVFVRVL